MQEENRFFEGHHVRTCSFFCSKTSREDQKKVITSADRSLHRNFPQFFVEECCDMFSLFVMSKRMTFGNFLASSEDNFFLVKKEDMSSKRKAYGNPTYLSLNLVEDLQRRPSFFNSLL